MMCKCMVLAGVFFLLAGMASADADQAGWFYGGGAPGPVVGWPLPSFYQSSDMDFWTMHLMGSTGPRKLRLSLAERNQISGVTDATPVSVYSSDLDGDGDEDVIALFGYMGGPEQILWWENPGGAGGFWDEHIIDIGFPVGQNVVSADIDGNGTMDVAAAGQAEIVCWWSNTDGTGTQWEEHLACNQADWVECADMDGDGDTDFALASWWSDTYLWCENIDGIGEIWEDHEIAQGIIGAWPGNPCDIDSDGDLDFTGLELLNNKVLWWENEDGTGETWIEHVICNSMEKPVAIHAGDVDGDGDFDVAAVSWEDDDLVWFRNEDGLGGAWTEVAVAQFELPMGRNLHDVHISDLDADGDMDIASLVHCSGGSIFWCENLDGLGESWQVHTFAHATPSAWSVHPTDINGDGKNDLVTCQAGLYASIGQDITWWDLNVNGYSPEGYLESSILDTDVISTDYHTLTWESDVPAGTELYLQIRASDDYNNMGDWSEPLYTSPVQVDEVVGDGEKYFQYRVNMETTEPFETPWLAIIELTWDMLGIEEGEVNNSGILSIPSNPLVSGNSSVFITCDTPMILAFSVFDLSGRRVHSIQEKQYGAGVSTVSVENLPPGIYICQVSCEDFQESIRFVLTE